MVPERGIVTPNSSKEFKIQCRTTHEHEIRGKNIYVNVRGGVRIQLPIFSKCILPNVLIVEPQINFGTISASSTCCHPLTFQNNQNQDVKIVVDLTPGPQGIEYLELLYENQVRISEHRLQITIPS